jgi:hypothetical protein
VASSDPYHNNSNGDAGDTGETRSDHAIRLQDSQARKFWEGSGFDGGDKNSLGGGREIEFTNDEIQILGEELSRYSPFEGGVIAKSLCGVEEMSQESLNQDVSRISDPGEAPLERAPTPVFPGSPSAPVDIPRGEFGERDGTEAHSSDPFPIKYVNRSTPSSSVNLPAAIVTARSTGESPDDHVLSNLARSTSLLRPSITVSLFENSRDASSLISDTVPRASGPGFPADTGDSVNPASTGLAGKPL